MSNMIDREEVETYYNPRVDSLIELIGEIELSDKSKLVVELRQYGDLAPRTAVFHSKGFRFDKRKQEHVPRLEPRIPRLRAVDNVDLAELLTVAAEKLVPLEEQYYAQKGNYQYEDEDR